MITVVFFLWHDDMSAWRREYIYGWEFVRRSIRMVDEHLSLPHEFVCATDDIKGAMMHLPGNVRIVNIPESLAIPSKRFQKLMVFHPNAADFFGERMLLMDLDNVVVDSIDSIVDRKEDIVLWENPSNRLNTRYNTSIVLLSAGCRPHVWTELDMKSVVDVVSRERLSGTDQAWVSRMLKDEATWTKDDGIYSYRVDHLRAGVQYINGTKIICFHGNISPLSDVVGKKHPWIQEAYLGGA